MCSWRAVGYSSVIVQLLWLRTSLRQMVIGHLVTKSCLTLCDPMDFSLPVSSVLGIFQMRILEWIAISFSRGSSQPRGQTWISCIAGRFFTAKPLGKEAIWIADPSCLLKSCLAVIQLVFWSLTTETFKFIPPLAEKGVLRVHILKNQ